MKITTHVLTNQQDLTPTQKETARKNIGIKVEDVQNSSGESLVDEHGVVTIPDGVAVDTELSPTSTNPVQNKVVTAALSDKVNKVAGKGLSTEDYTTNEKSKLDGIAAGAEVNVQSDWEESNPESDAYILNKPQNLVQDANYVHTDNNYTNDDKSKLGGIAAGAEVNVQSDWDESNPESDAYILNKPENLVQDANYVHTDNNYTTNEQTKLGGIEDNAQVNTIETVKVDNQALTPDENKAVNIDLSGKEDVENKITEWSNEPSTTKYPAESLVKSSLDDKVDKVAGKQLSTEDYTTDEKAKLVGIEANAQVNKIETVKVDNQALTPDTNKAVNIDLTGKADKVTRATSGNFAGLDANGNLTDSGNKAADFATAAQGAKAESAIQGVTLNGSTLTPDNDKVVDLGDLKTKQQVVPNPGETSEDGVSFIDTASQNENGEIAVTRKNVPFGSTSKTGLVRLTDSCSSTSVTTAATPNSVKSAYDLADSAVKGVQKNGVDITLDSSKKANVVVNDAKLYVKIGSASVVEKFSADAIQDSTIDIPLAAYDTTETPTEYTEGLITGQDKEKLDGIAASADVNVIEGVKLEGESNPLSPDGNKIVTIPDASTDTSGATPVYTHGLMSAADKEKIDGIESGAQVNDIEHIKIEGELTDLTIDVNKRVEIPLAASATTSPAASAKAGIMSASDKAKLDGIEPSADVNIIEGVKLEGEQNPINPDASKVVTIPEAAVDSSGAEPVYTHGLMSATDKEKLDTLKNFTTVAISDGVSPAVPCGPNNDNDTLTFEAGHNISLAKAANSNKITITASADPVTVSAGAGIEITETPIQGGGTDYEVGVKGGHMGYLIDTSISISHIKNGDDIIIPASASNPISTSGDDRFVIYHDATSGHNYLAALKPIPASGNDPAVAGVDLFTLSVNINVAYMPRGNGYFYRAGVNIHDVGNNVLLSQSVETYPSQVGECSVDQTFTIKNTSNNTVTIDGKEYCCYRITYVGESDTTQDDPAGNAHVSLTAHVSAMEIAVGIIEHTGSGSTLGAGEAISIANDLVSVKHGDGLGINSTTGNLEVKLGSGLKFDTTGSAEAVITLDNPTEEVVQTVQKMQTDLDTKLTTNFAMPQITHVYDFADRSVSTLTSGACMLCQAFTVPINNGIRLETETETPTLFGIYAQQNFGHKIMLALYAYDFNTGSTDYVADTGPVDVVAGRNEFPIKHINPNITELKSDCVYYASLYLPSAACVNGLFLCGCPSYQAASQINAIPRFTVGVDNITYNGSEISMDSDTTGRLDYNDGNGHYYIGPWTSTYNEHPNAPRFFMQIRNATGGGSVATDPFTNITNYSLEATNGIVDVFQSTTVPLSPDGNDLVMQQVSPALNVTIKEWTFYDTNATDPNDWGKRVYTSGFTQLVTVANVSATHTAVGSKGYYEHKYVYSTGLSLDANSSYWFPAGVSFDTNDKLVQYTSATPVPKKLVVFDDGSSVYYGAYSVFEDNAQGTFLKLKDSNNQEWTI